MSEYLIKAIIGDKGLDELEKDFLTKISSMVYNWKELSDILLFMSISEKTEIKIRKILNNIGDEMIEICEIMINENNI